VEVPDGETEVRASVAGVRDLFSPFIASIEIWVDEKLVRRFSATAQVEAFAPVLVAAHDLPAGRLHSDDVEVAASRLRRPLNNYLREAGALKGVALRRPLAKGEAITRDTIFADIVVHPGDHLRLIGESGKIRVIAEGEARAMGRIGDRIQVKNIQSGVLLQAVIIDEGIARVIF
jgi:flagella basal body P-ring formation protein FlgA